MMKNLSELITGMKLKLGIMGITLPFEDTNKTFHDLLKLETLPMFSTFAPFIMSVDFKTTELKCLKNDYNQSIYELPDVFGDRKIIYIKNVKPNNKMYNSGYIDPLLEAGMDTYGVLALGQASADLLSAASPPFTFDFKEPNLLYLYNNSSLLPDITVDIAFEHADNLSTISNTMWRSFYKLALLDMKILLYNTLKHYNEIQSSFGTINLKIDEWAGAESEREELLEKWTDSFHLDGNAVFFI